ncbi:restriction endonuclease subunit S [Maricaulis sp.]|uniref:restriction endonuclease subunit S n=1 Tax=Maricaulis sp. TaxID=1486257 RepID=UPI003A9119FB
MSAVPELRFPGFDGEWLARPLENLCSTVTSGSRDWAKYYSDAGSKFIRMTNLSRDNTRLLLDDLKYVALPSNSSEGSRTSLCSGDVLISITAELGKIGLVPHDLGEAFINQHTALVRPSPKDAVPAFLAQCLATKKSNKRLNRLNDSGAKSGLNLSTVRSFEVRTPALPEQQKIAAFLGAVDNKIDALRRKHDALKQFKAGLMQKLFSQELRFKREDGSDYPDWEEKRLGDVCDVDWGNTSLTKSAYVEGGQYIAVSATGCDGRIDMFEHQAGTPVLSAIGANCGKMFLPDEPFTAIKNTMVFTGATNSNFLYYSLCQHRFSIQGAGQPFIGKKDTEKSTIRMPGQPEQQKIADCLSAMDAKIEAVDHQITHIETFKAGLLQKMFV